MLDVFFGVVCCWVVVVVDVLDVDVLVCDDVDCGVVQLAALVWLENIVLVYVDDVDVELVVGWVAEFIVVVDFGDDVV